MCTYQGCSADREFQIFGIWINGVPLYTSTINESDLKPLHSFIIHWIIKYEAEFYG